MSSEPNSPSTRREFFRTVEATALSGRALGANDRSGLRLDWDARNKTVSQEPAEPFLHREYRSPWKLEV